MTSRLVGQEGHCFLVVVYTMLLHSPLPFYPTFPSSPTSPSAPPVSFYSLILPHIDLTMALSVLLKIAISCSLKHHVSLPYNIADFTQLR